MGEIRFHGAKIHTRTEISNVLLVLKEGDHLTYSYDPLEDGEPNPPAELVVQSVRFGPHSLVVDYKAMSDLSMYLSDFMDDAFLRYRQDLVDFYAYRNKLRERYGLE